MIFVTIYYLWSKYYLNLIKIVANGKRSLQSIAGAINKYHYFLQKNIKKNYSFLHTFMN